MFCGDKQVRLGSRFAYLQMSKSWKTLVAAVVVSGAVSGVAIADGYEYEPVSKGFAPVPEVFSWTGFYVGGHLGYSWVDVSGIHDSGGAVAAQTNLNNLDLDESFGGVQAGYNFQAGQFVYGVEGDYSWLSNSDTIPAGPVNDDIARAEIDYLASIRARLGWAWQNVLLFGTVGWGWADYEFSVTETDAAPPVTGKISFSEDGIVYGGGIDVGLTKAVSVRAEYLRYDVGARRALTEPPIPDADDPGDFVEFDDIDVVRGVLSFRLY